jgi:hypothetical protein
MNVLIGAGAVLAIMSGTAGCTTPAPAADSVRVTTSLDDVSGCNLLGKIIVSDTSPDPAKEARQQTALVHGNVLLRKNDQVWNGNAYQCPAAVH